jgi:hypothetical protein
MIQENKFNVILDNVYGRLVCLASSSYGFSITHIKDDVKLERSLYDLISCDRDRKYEILSFRISCPFVPSFSRTEEKS